jgi:transaldolase
VTSFFVSRVDTEADRDPEDIRGHDELRGTLVAIANAKLAYQNCEIFTGPDWRSSKWPARRLSGAWGPRLGQEPRHGDVIYVEQLIGPERQHRAPLEIAALQDHGQITPTREEGVNDARRTLDSFAQGRRGLPGGSRRAGARMGAEFADSFKELFAGVSAKRDEFAVA